MSDSPVSIVRTCACGCNTSLAGMRPEARYASDACRARAWKDRTGYADPRRRKAARNGRAQRRRAPDLRVSYRKALDALARYLQSIGRPAARREAAELLEPLLTDRQREALAADRSGA